MLKQRRGEFGFTLIETLAALVVFFIMTVGVVPLIASSMRGATLSRSYTVGKNVVVQAMERVRGLPYFVTSTDRIDVLDIYFPDKVAPNYVAGVYTTTCTPAAASVACPANAVPAGHTVVYEAAFVEKAPSADPAAPEQYQVKEPPDGYRWDTAATPPEPLLRMVIRGSWIVNGQTRTYELESLIGDRRFGGLKIDGSAVVDYGVQIQTAFRNDLDQESGLTVVGGFSESRIESRLLTTADQVANPASLILIDRTSPLTAERNVAGANAVATAPPDGPILTDSEAPVELTHPDFLETRVAGADSTSVGSVRATVQDDLPIAHGEQAFASTGALGLLWADTQADTTETSPLRLRDTGAIAWVRAGFSPGLEATTDATASELATQQVSTTAEVDVGSFLLLPTSFITDTTAEGAVVEVRGFQADVSCLAKPVSGTAGGSWSATLRYWQDPPDLAGDGDGDGDEDEDELIVAPGGYVDVLLGDSTGAQTLENVQANPPMVYEDPTNTDPWGSPDDIYLFEPPAADHRHLVDHDDDALTDPIEIVHQHRAYLADWSALAGVTSDDTEPQLTSAGISGAIRMTTTRTNPALLESVVNVALGSLSCRSLEAR